MAEGAVAGGDQVRSICPEVPLGVATRFVGIVLLGSKDAAAPRAVGAALKVPEAVVTEFLARTV